MTEKEIIREAMRLMGKRRTEKKRKASAKNMKKARAARWPNKKPIVE